MKTFIVVATLSLISAAAFAKAVPSAADAHQPAVQYIFQGDSLAPVDTAPLTKRRAEVIAELKASQARMDYVRMGDELVPRSTFMSQRSKAEVRTEAATQRQSAGHPAESTW